MSARGGTRSDLLKTIRTLQDQLHAAIETGRRNGPAFAAVSWYPLRSVEECAQWLIKHRLLDECALYDSDGYDGGRSLARIASALQDAAADTAMEVSDGDE